MLPVAIYNFIRLEAFLNNCQLDPAIASLIVKELKTIDDVKRVILFGSRARGTADIRSDIDIAVLSESDTGNMNAVLNEEIPTLLKIDLVQLNRADNRLSDKISRDGAILYEKP